MKKTSLIIIMLLAIAIGINAQKTYVLLAGVSNYGNDKVNLRNTTKDVKELKAVFDNQNAVVATVTSKYANHDNIVRKLNAIVQLAKAEDNIIFFFSGHGAPGGFIEYNQTLFKYSELATILSKARTQKVFCFIDACHSGSASQSAGTNYSWGSQGKNKLTFVMACRADELSWENSWLGNGYFSQGLIKGLRGKADTNGDKKITMSELFVYTYKDVTSRTKNSKDAQHPQMFGPKEMFDTVLTKW